MAATWALRMAEKRAASKVAQSERPRAVNWADQKAGQSVDRTDQHWAVQRAVQ